MELSDIPLIDKMREAFKQQQLEKNAESVRTHHPEYRRHQRAIQEEIAKVVLHFEETIQDRYIATMVETLLYFQQIGHPTNLYEYPLAPGASEPRVGYEVHRKPETPAAREARIKAWQEKQAIQNPEPPRDDDDDYYDE